MTEKYEVVQSLMLTVIIDELREDLDDAIQAVAIGRHEDDKDMIESSLRDVADITEAIANSKKLSKYYDNWSSNKEMCMTIGINNNRFTQEYLTKEHIDYKGV